MKKNEIFTFTAPNGVESTAICLKNLVTVGNMTQYLCYGQNRLFTMNEFCYEWTEETGEVCQESQMNFGEIILEHIALPDYDIVLYDIVLEECCQHEEHEESIKIVQGFGHTKAEAINILEGKNPDSSGFEEMPF